MTDKKHMRIGKAIKVIESFGGISIENIENSFSHEERETKSGESIHVVKGMFLTSDDREVRYTVYFDENETVLGFNLASPNVPQLAPW